MGGLVVYVTSHGFGHLNRSVAVINKMPLCVPVTIRCDPNMFAHWHERLTRHATLEPHISDAGAVNPPGDSAFEPTATQHSNEPPESTPRRWRSSTQRPSVYDRKKQRPSFATLPPYLSSLQSVQAFPASCSPILHGPRFMLPTHENWAATAHDSSARFARHIVRRPRSFERSRRSR